MWLWKQVKWQVPLNFILEFEVLLGQPMKKVTLVFDQEICQMDRFNKTSGTGLILVKGDLYSNLNRK